VAESDVSLDLSGLEQIGQKLDRLDNNVRKNIARKALRAGLKPILTEAKRNAPVGHYLYPSEQARRRAGSLVRSIAIRSGRSTRDSVALRVGLGKKWFVGDQFYAAFLEFGWRPGKRSGAGLLVDKKGRTRRVRVGSIRSEIPGEHFMEHSYEESKPSAIAEMSSTFLTELENAQALI
jgi:HK97 gp10 family phage protein